MLSGRNALGVAEEVSAQLSVTERDALLSYLPLCHVAEKIFTYFIPLCTGAIVHFGESIDTVRQDLAEVSRSFSACPEFGKNARDGHVEDEDSSWLKKTLFRWAVLRGQGILERRHQGQDTLWDGIIYRIADSHF